MDLITIVPVFLACAILAYLISYNIAFRQGYADGFNRAAEKTGLQPGDTVELKTGSVCWVVDKIEDQTVRCIRWHPSPPGQESYIEEMEIIGLHLLKRVEIQ
jgi:hypothetical protein